MEHPVTKWVQEACQRASDAQKEEWDKVTWDGGQCDPLMLMELRTRADAYRALAETPYEGWCAVLEVEPVYGE